MGPVQTGSDLWLLSWVRDRYLDGDRAYRILDRHIAFFNLELLVPM